MPDYKTKPSVLSYFTKLKKFTKSQVFFNIFGV